MLRSNENSIVVSVYMRHVNKCAMMSLYVSLHSIGNANRRQSHLSVGSRSEGTACEAILRKNPLATVRSAGDAREKVYPGLRRFPLLPVRPASDCRVCPLCLIRPESLMPIEYRISTQQKINRGYS